MPWFNILRLVYDCLCLIYIYNIVIISIVCLIVFEKNQTYDWCSDISVWLVIALTPFILARPTLLQKFFSGIRNLIYHVMFCCCGRRSDDSDSRYLMWGVPTDWTGDSVKRHLQQTCQLTRMPDMEITLGGEGTNCWALVTFTGMVTIPVSYVRRTASNEYLSLFTLLPYKDDNIFRISNDWFMSSQNGRGQQDLASALDRIYSDIKSRSGADILKCKDNNSVIICGNPLHVTEALKKLAIHDTKYNAATAVGNVVNRAANNNMAAGYLGFPAAAAVSPSFSGTGMSAAAFSGKPPDHRRPSNSSTGSDSKNKQPVTDQLHIDEYLWLYAEEFKLLERFSQNHDVKLVTSQTGGKERNFDISGQSSDQVRAAAGKIVELFQSLNDEHVTEDIYQIPQGSDSLKLFLKNHPEAVARADKFLLKRVDNGNDFRLIGPVGRMSHIKKKLNGLIGQWPEVAKSNTPGARFYITPLAKLNVRVECGDLVKQEVDAIVNPANVNLEHGGGAAKMIADAAGRHLLEECDKFKKQYGQLEVSQAVLTTAGKLRPKIQYVIHVAGPSKDMRSKKGTVETKVEEAFYNCLQHANDHASNERKGERKISSIAIPAISSGIFGVDKQVVATAAYKALIKFDSLVANGRCSRTLVDIRFVNIDAESTNIFQHMFDDKGLEPDSSFQRGVPAVSSCPPSGKSVKCGDDRRSDRTHSASRAQREQQRAADRNGPQSMPYQSSRQQSPEKEMRQPVASNCGDQIDVSPVLDDKKISRRRAGSVDSAKKKEIRNGAAAAAAAADADVCVICLQDEMTLPKTLDCGHRFCSACIDDCFKQHQPKCPTCGQMFGAMKGNQPEDGEMNITTDQSTHLAGYERYATLVIEYNIPSGVQGHNHPNPGQRYQGTRRIAYLPCNTEGKEVGELLKKAFDAGLIFTVGRSNTNGKDNQVVWNDVHHKTSIYGSPYGYPDPTYLSRVKEELAAKGITSIPNAPPRKAKVKADQNGKRESDF